jgi:outer membrane protein assembly factor BamD (BamD/ComL family)
MSIVGILASNFFSAKAAPGTAGANQSIENNPSKFQQIKAEFQQLGQDLQSGNLTQAQSDFATLSKDFPGLNQSTGSTSSGAANNPVAQAFTQLGLDLQTGKLQAAQQDFTNLQKDLQNGSGQQVQGHLHRQHHHHTESSETSSREANPIVQAFSTLGQDLQAGNLSGAQSAFATLQNDLQQIGGFLMGGPNGASGSVSPTSAGSLNVTA